MKRTLSLRGEHLAELTPAELASVDGAAQQTLQGCIALTFDACDRLSITCLTGYYPSLNAPCTTP
ncbi:MAG TPA: hypothetical protein VGX28_05640 [Frankiaceae bacterium]|jgi:hypothetical protein|nr:hypothetical protein [Frankiaceae bacterium]